MEFFRRAVGSPASLGILAGAFNPPTRAHLALARAALGLVDEVVFVLPRSLPHKEWEGASFEQRLRLLDGALAGEPRFSTAASERGLFIEIARECRAAYGPAVSLSFVCGRDAAERIANWDYGESGTLLEQFREYQLLVAPRQGDYLPPPETRAHIHPLRLPDDYEACSATEVRNRIRGGRPWEHLVPESILPLVREIYAA